MIDDPDIIELSDFKQPEQPTIPVDTVFSMKYPTYTVETSEAIEHRILKETVAKLQEQVYDGYKRIMQLNLELNILKSKYEPKE